MKDFIKPLIITLPIYVILFFLIFGKNDKFSPKDLMKELNQRDSIISKRIDNQGRAIIEHTNREYVPFTIQNSNDAEMVALRSELASLGIKLNDLKSAIVITTTSSGKGEVQVVKISDTLDRYAFADTTGKHLKLSGEVDTKNGKMSYNYTYSAKYNLISHNVKPNVFKRPELRLTIVSDDPNSNITAQTFNIKPPKDIASIGVGVGASVLYDNTFKIRPTIQVGLYKPILTFRKRK